MVVTSEPTRPEAPTIELAHGGDARRTFFATLAAIGVVLIGYWLLIPQAGYHDIVTALQFAGSPERLSERIAEQRLEVSLTDARWAMVSAAGFSVVWGATGWLLMRNCWAGAWKAGVGRRTSGAVLGVVLGAGGAAIGIVEKLLTFVALRATGDAVRFADSPGAIVPKAIVTLAWAKWLLAGIMIALVLAMLVSSATAAFRRALPPRVPDLPTDTSTGDQEVSSNPVGICCSGGGVRAAGFVLGALARLEEEPEKPPSPGKLGILGRADYLASVSGGGYAAAGWRIAAGTGELPDEPIIGNPLDPCLHEPLPADPDAPDPCMNRRIRAYPKADEPATNLVQHVQERRRYLSNGPGGMLTSALIVMCFMVFHFMLLLLSVFVLAWPFGRILVSWAITGDGRSPDVMSVGVSTDIGIHQWLPPVAAAAVGVALSVWRIGLDRTTTRQRLDRAITGALGMAGSLFIVLIALPHAVDWLVAALPEGGGRLFAVAGIYGSVLTAVWQLAKARLRKVARYLGGLLLATGLTLFALFVMAHAADTDEMFSSFYAWAIGLVAMVVAFVLFNPDRWSLHGFYRTRLAGTFATERQPEGGLLPHPNEPPLAAYRDAEGPQPIICCAAARTETSHTGIPVLSMTFEPCGITLYRWSGEESTATSSPYAASHADFQARLPRNTHGHNLETVMGAAAVSGAAVAPSLGRKSMRGTDALLAAFNARLGVWVPNPGQMSYPNSTTPRLVNMFKEIIKTYDLDNDPNVYATDGGHWENLGLVELIRRRCAVIVCIDASGDQPGTYNTLKQAIKLARLECEARVEIDDWSELAVDAEGVANKNFATGTVTYENGDIATLLYVKAAVMQSTPLHIQRYASGDLRFPNYSTSDQSLAAEEFSHLIHLGYSSMSDALDDNEDFVFLAMSGADARPTSTP